MEINVQKMNIWRTFEFWDSHTYHDAPASTAKSGMWAPPCGVIFHAEFQLDQYILSPPKNRKLDKILSFWLMYQPLPSTTSAECGKVQLGQVFHQEKSICNTITLYGENFRASVTVSEFAQLCSPQLDIWSQLHYTRALQPVATCRQTPYLRPAIIVVTSFSLWRHSRGSHIRRS